MVWEAMYQGVVLLGAGVQALIARLLVLQQPGGVPPVQGAMLLQGSWCLWSSLSTGYTAALSALATAVLLPAVQAAAQPSLGKRITSTLGYARHQTINLFTLKGGTRDGNIASMACCPGGTTRPNSHVYPCAGTLRSSAQHASRRGSGLPTEDTLQ